MMLKLNQNSIFIICLLLRLFFGRFAVIWDLDTVLFCWDGLQDPGNPAVYGLVMSAYNVVLSCTLTGVALSVSRIASSYQALGEGGSIIQLIRTALFLFLGLFACLQFLLRLQRFLPRRYWEIQKPQQHFYWLFPAFFWPALKMSTKPSFYGTGQTFPPTVSETLEMLCRIIGAFCLFSMFAAKAVHRLQMVGLLHWLFAAWFSSRNRQCNFPDDAVSFFGAKTDGPGMGFVYHRF